MYIGMDVSFELLAEALGRIYHCNCRYRDLGGLVAPVVNDYPCVPDHKNNVDLVYTDSSSL